MARAVLTIDLDAIVDNWTALDRLSAPGVETTAVVKADAYGLGVAPVATALARAGVRTFFVALAEEGAALRTALGPGPRILFFSGPMGADMALARQADLIPVINAPGQMATYRAAPTTAYALHVDSGLNRLGFGVGDATAAVEGLGAPEMVLSHLASADTPEAAANQAQLAAFQGLAGALEAPLSLAATGGILLGPDFHFGLTRPGIGLYGGKPFHSARPVVDLALPVLQIRHLAPGERVGYGGTWVAKRPSRVATLWGGYADGLFRSMGGRVTFYAEGQALPSIGRMSMDLIAVDVTDLGHDPVALELLSPEQTVDDVAAAAGTIGYEILTALGPRYERVYRGGGAAGSALNR